MPTSWPVLKMSGPMSIDLRSTTVGLASPSSQAILSTAVGWWSADDSALTTSSQTLTNRGTAGAALDATFGSTGGADTNDPTFLPHTGVDYVWMPLSGGYVSAPDPGHFTEIDVAILVAMDDWTTGTNRILAAHYDPGAGNASWYLRLGLTDRLGFVISDDGTNVYTDAAAAAAPSLAVDGTPLWIRGTYDPDVGGAFEAKFYEAAWDGTVVVPSSWTQIGSTVTGTSRVPYNTPSPFHVPWVAGGYTGKCYRVAAATTVGGLALPIVDFHPDGRTATAADMSTLTSGGAVWTFTRTAAPSAQTTLVTRPALQFGADDYLEVADDAAFSIANGGEFTALVAYRHQRAQQSAVVEVASHRPAAGGAGWSLRSRAATDVTALVADDGVATDTDNGAASSVGRAHVVTGRVTATTVEARLDGTSAATTARTAAAINHGGVLRIGAPSDAATNEFSGEVFCAAIWNRALSANEVAALETLYSAGT